MVHPFDDLENLGWKPVDGQVDTVKRYDIPSVWECISHLWIFRPLAGAELVLDQVRRLNEGYIES